MKDPARHHRRHRRGHHRHRHRLDVERLLSMTGPAGKSSWATTATLTPQRRTALTPWRRRHKNSLLGAPSSPKPLHRLQPFISASTRRRTSSELKAGVDKQVGTTPLHGWLRDQPPYPQPPAGDKLKIYGRRLASDDSCGRRRSRPLPAPLRTTTSYRCLRP